ncbi:MAG: transposase [Beijerinckiaceae bacterium]
MRSLAVLVGAAVADLVRDAVIAGPAGVRLDRIADHAGCGLVEDDAPDRALGAALAMARCDHVLVLQGGYAPGLGFIDEATDWLAMRGRHDAAALRAEPENLAQRLLPTLAPAAGVLARRSDCLALSASDLPGIARKLRARTLRSRARRLV